MNTFGGGFNQSKLGGFNQPAAGGGFGQVGAPQQAGFGQAQSQQHHQQVGGFGQPQQQGGLFGQQPHQAGGLGAQPGQQIGGFGQPQPQPQQQLQANMFGQRPGVGGFGQQAGGFGQPQQQQAGGFGQQAGGFSQPQQQQAGGFSQAPQAGAGGFFQQQQQQPVAGGFGQPQPQQAGGFGAQAGSFGQQAGGFGQQQVQQQQQQQPGVWGGFGQQAAPGGFGQAQQTAAGGFGAVGRGAGGFGQQVGGFGQQQHQQPVVGGGFGQQPAVGGFGQAQQTAAGGFGAGRGATTGFGQQLAGGGFGTAQQPAAGGFGQQPAVGGFGGAQQPAAGGFGQGAAGSGFGAGRGATTGFGAAAGGTSGFGAQQPAAGGFGQPTTNTGFGSAAAGTGFGQPAANTGFGQQAGAVTGGFGQAAVGGFGAAGRGAGGFGQQQPAAGGFGQQPAVGGFGGAQQPAAGGFGQGAAGSGFGAGRGATTGFGAAAGGTSGFGAQQPAAGGFGQPTTNTGFGSAAAGTGFGQPATGAVGFGQQPGAAGMGFGQPAASIGFGQAPAATGLGQQPGVAGGFGHQQPATIGGIGQAPAPAAAGAPGGSSGLNFGRPTDLSFMSLPDYNASPYGNVLLFDTYERPIPAKPVPKSQEGELGSIAASSRRAIHTWLVGQMRVPEENTLLNQGPVSLGSSALSPFALKDMLVPAVQLGAAKEAAQAAPAQGGSRLPQAQPQHHQPSSRPLSAPAEDASSNAAAPWCSNPDLVLRPSLAELSTYAPEELRRLTKFSVRLRDGTCEMHFLQPVNVVRVDVGEAVSLSRDGRAALYPGGAAPPLGSGLNVCVEVRVRDETGELKEALEHYCKEAPGRSFEGYRQGYGIYYLNKTGRANDGAAKGGASRAADTSELYHYPLSIIHDDEDETYTRNLDDTRDSSERDLDEVYNTGSSCVSDDDARDGGAVPAAAAAPPATVVVRQLAVPAASRLSEVAERRLAAAGGDEFKLPYKLPDMSSKSKVEPFDVKLGSARPSLESRVYYVCAPESAIQRAYVNHAGGLKGSENTVRGMLARSSRASWSTAGTLAFASHAELRDGADADSAVAEVVGARAVAAMPFHWHKPATKAITQCAVSLLRLFLQQTDVTDGGACPLACIRLHRDKSHNTLSEEKLLVAQRAVEDVVASKGASLTRLETLSTRQTVAVLSLLSALYALPEADDALPNAVEEARYLCQLRHRNLAGWLKRELAAFLDETRSSTLSPAEELVQIMLCHKLREARTSARSIANEELARVVRVCGEGNQFGGYVEMAKGGFKDGEEVRQRVVALLSGKVEPFIKDDEYKGVADGAAEVRPVPSAATWKQLLGIFTFYGCVPDTPAEEIVLTFLDRLRAPSSRTLNPLPPYAERVDAQMLRTKRGKDLVCRGNTFQDAALLLLEGFANGSAPPASCLHPHASSYVGTDYTTALVIVAAIRAIQLPRERAYQDAEVSVLLGMTAALECNDETWFWGLFPLHLIESPVDREDAVRSFCKRNAMRAAALREQGGQTTDFDRLLSLLRVNMAWLEPVVSPIEDVRRAPENSPSLATHSALEKALAKLAL